MELQHKHIKQKNFIARPVIPEEIIVNRPVQFNRKIPHQTLSNASGLTNKIN